MKEAIITTHVVLSSFVGFGWALGLELVALFVACWLAWQNFLAWRLGWGVLWDRWTKKSPDAVSKNVELRPGMQVEAFGYKLAVKGNADGEPVGLAVVSKLGAPPPAPAKIGGASRKPQTA